MFRWYEKAEVCYAYLSDVRCASKLPGEDYSQFSQSKWFTRGWTLQELLAPDYVDFNDQTWTWIGSKGSLDTAIRNVTGIADLVDYRKASVAQKMSWASRRETTRVEDLSYCLLGLFGVHMPPLYGEGENAFIRLQREIMSTTDDDSLLAWITVRSGYEGGLLATSPRMFVGCSSVVRVVWDPNRPPHTMSSKGLCVHLKLVPRKDGIEEFLAPLNCAFDGGLFSRDWSRQVIALQICRRVSENTSPWYRHGGLAKMKIVSREVAKTDRTVIYVPQQLRLSPSEEQIQTQHWKIAHICFTLASVFRTGLKHEKYFAGQSGANWTRKFVPGFEHGSMVLDISAHASFPVRAAITLEKLAKYSDPLNKPYTGPENYFQKIAIVFGLSNGRPWIDIMVLAKNEDIRLILKASLPAMPASDGDRATNLEGAVPARTLSTGLDRVSRKFFGGSLNGRLMTVKGRLYQLLVEVTYDPEGKLRWPVRAPLSPESSFV
jgi:hypothetical protein